MKHFSNLGEVLHREQLKSVLGGTNLQVMDQDERYAKCCWDNDPSNCSKCVTTWGGCVSGAHLVDC